MQEAELITAIRQGQKQAFELVFREHYSSLVNYACTLVKDHDESEDLVQQLFVTLWTRRENLQVHTSLKAYLFRAVHNSSLNRLKQENVRQLYSKETLAGHAPRVTVQDSLSGKELEHRIEQALDRLPEQCGLVFKMSRFEHLKYQEIADKLGISVKTVENHMGKALRLMREQLKEFIPLVMLSLLWQYLN